MPDDLTASARKRAEELEQAASGIPAPPYSYRSWQHDDWGMVRNHQGPVANTAMQSIIWRWRAEVYDKIEGDPRPAWEAGPPETQALGEFLVHAANTANENAGLLTALAARVDEQERRIEELEGDAKTLASLLAEHTDWQPDLPVQKQRPTHGSCCTCQDCGFAHDECMCEHNAITEALSQKGGE